MFNPQTFYNNLISQISSSFVDRGQIFLSPVLTWTTYKSAAKNAIIQKLIQITNGSINQNGWDIKVKTYQSEKKNEKLSREIYQICEEINLVGLFWQIISLGLTYGNCFIVIADNKPKVYTPDMFNIYWNKYTQKVVKITANIDGREQQTDFVMGENFFHFKYFLYENEGLADSILDTIYVWLEFEKIAIAVNSNMIERGNIGIVIPIFEKEMSEALERPVMETPDGEPTSTLNVLLRKFRELFGGWQNSHKMATMMTGVKEIVELGKDNDKMQLQDMFDRAEAKYYDAFGIERTTENSNRASASTLTYQLDNNIAKAWENQLERFVNQFLWKNCINPIMVEKFGYSFENSAQIYFQFNKPSDPDELAKMTLYRDTFINSASIGKPLLTLNETREFLGLPEAPTELLELWQQANQPTLPTQNQPQLNFEAKKKSPTELALESKDYSNLKYDEKTKKKIPKGFLPSWEKAIAKQLTQFITDYQKDQKATLPKIETFYSFNALKKDLFVWIDFGIENAKKEIASEKFAENLDYSKEIMGWVDKRAEALLKGNELFKSVDEATSTQILDIIKAEVEAKKPITEIVKTLTDWVPKISKNRAELIAETEVASAVEFGRFDHFESEGFTEKKQLSINDGRDTIWSKKAAALGWVDINFEYETQFGKKSKTLPLNYRERGTLIFRS